VLGTSFVSDRARLPGAQQFSRSGSVTFAVNPGDAFYVWSALSVTANSSHQIIGSVDALHTLAPRFAAGDTSLLVPAGTALPEPASTGLLAVALMLLAIRMRIRRRTPTIAAVASALRAIDAASRLAARTRGPYHAWR
jgi:hypothetical protein